MNILMIMTLSLFNADFSISTASLDQFHPSTIFKNNQYYVFWADYRHAPLYYSSLYCARITTDGVVLDSNGRVLHRDSVLDPSVAYDGTNFLAVWREGC